MGLFMEKKMLEINEKGSTAMEQAKAEIKQENFDARVEEEKIKLRTKKTVWEKVFPWNINLTISRK